MADEDFLPRLGGVKRERSYAGELKRTTNLARGAARAMRGRSGFTGERIGRGAGVGRVLGSSDRFAHARGRRVIVKARIVKLAGKGAAGAVAHLRYLQRDGTTRDGERGALYGPDDSADGRAFLERGTGDRHQFRFIVAAEDGAEYDELKPLVRRMMTQAELDLGTKLDWVALDHFNTGHPHSHIIVRGTDERGADLIIAREYMTKGFRARATELVNLDLGPRTELEMLRAQTREITQERFTSIDQRLVAAIDANGRVSPAHHDSLEQAARAGRLQTLGRLGLATEERRGVWTLNAELEPTLKAMARRGDIIATMHHEMGKHQLSQNSADYAIFDPAQSNAKPIIGRVLTAGLSDELADRRYLILEGVDGQAHHIDVGELTELPRSPAIVRIVPTEVAVRPVDHTVADVAAANGGQYSVDLHLKHDPTASETFAETHVRRLEAIRRWSGGVERAPDGSWTIAPDHIARVEAHERKLAEQKPISIELLSSKAIDQLPAHNGVTWLDRELVADDPTKLERGFGAEVRRALQLRQQWLIEEGLVQGGAGKTRYPAEMLDTLQRRELVRVGAQLSAELGLSFADAKPGREVDGILTRAVQIGDSKFALIQKNKEFTLVPWRPVLDRHIGKQVSGIVREAGGISWTIGRSRGLAI